MKEVGMLNSDISDVLSRAGHRDEIMVCDAGFAIPLGVRTIDIALSENCPTVEEVIDELLKYFSVEELVIADESRQTNPSKVQMITGLFEDGIKIQFIDHEELKKRSRQVKAIIRTGDFTAYSNFLLISAGGPRWLLEKN